jgi:hypothetical protein
VNQYAATTQVPVDKSKAEIEKTLRRYGATSFAYYSDHQRAIVAFVKNERQIRFALPMPDPNDREFTHSSRGPRSPSVREGIYEQATRQKWRALNLVIKAKLEAVEAGIVTFEDEFMAHMVLPNGATVAEYVGPQIEEAYNQADASILRIGPA